MRFFSPTLLFAGISILSPLSLCAPPVVENAALQSRADPLRAAPLHVPVCEPQPGRFDLFVCARLLATLKNLPYYQQREIWSFYARGEGHLPAVFSLSDRSGQRQCFLTLDLYEPGVPQTAKETFSLKEEQHEFNNIYFECLKNRGLGGFDRIGFFGNVAAFLGPRLEAGNPLLTRFRMLSAKNATELDNVPVRDLTPLEDGYLSTLIDNHLRALADQ